MTIDCFAFCTDENHSCCSSTAVLLEFINIKTERHISLLCSGKHYNNCIFTGKGKSIDQEHEYQ